MNLNKLLNEFLDAAIEIGGETWEQIKTSTPLYAKGYLRSLADIAAGVVDGEITEDDAQMYVSNARLLLIMGIANTSHVVFVKVQAFIDRVLDTVKGAINDALPVPLLD